jgi:Flp pilus assembly protein TadD
VKLWDVRSWLEVLTFRNHNTSVWGVAFSPDGRLATAGIPTNGVVKIWDGRPWIPEAAIEREALGILQALFGKPLGKADVIAYLREAKTIRPEAVQKALSLADRYEEETDPEKYYQSSWAIVRKSYLNAIQYGFALQQAQAARQRAPDQAHYRTALGIAQYRLGRYREALATLTPADPMAVGSPADLAFLAMTQHELGQKEQAQATLIRLRETLRKLERVKDDEASRFLREAEALIEGKSPDPKK